MKYMKDNFIEVSIELAGSQKLKKLELLKS